MADRAGAMFSYWRQAVDADWHCLLRVVHDRRIQGEDDGGDHLREWAASLPLAAEETLHLRTRPDRVARTVTLAVAWGHTYILPSRNDPTATGKPPVEAWVIRAWETTVPSAGEAPLEWLLLSTLPVEDARQAHERLQWYRYRWLIEHYHKALKTGCRMEDSQLQQGEALKRQLGFLSVVAVRLLQMETLARTVPDRPARQAVDPQLLEFVCRLRHLDAAQLTIYQFWREVAKFGGFLGRKGDSEPGWQTLWRGWNYLYPRYEGYLLDKNVGNDKGCLTRDFLMQQSDGKTTYTSWLSRHRKIAGGGKDRGTPGGHEDAWQAYGSGVGIRLPGAGHVAVRRSGGGGD